MNITSDQLGSNVRAILFEICHQIVKDNCVRLCTTTVSTQQCISCSNVLGQHVQRKMITKKIIIKLFKLYKFLIP